ncbi:MAG: ATP-binding cassette domain-containing protein [Actinobacteria bacterium]|jgi:ABC-2 type transport system ATP-binding protein|nr:ATP-binding cassette domain-containing protein [Actinomycetota bacterium]MCL6105327.1 ATP-binding cassette domain-containing protein [Actinomycetota bacterium]
MESSANYVNTANAVSNYASDQLAAPSILVHNLTKRFGTVLAVDSLSFEVFPGKITAFLGPNGAGKTTTLRIVLGLSSPTSGSVSILTKPYEQIRNPSHKIGAVLETSNFYPGRSAENHLKVLAISAGIPIKRIYEVANIVGLSQAIKRRVGGFSLGMRQRLSLACALLGNPSILILDEPANGLDPEGIHWLRQFLRDFAGDNKTVFISSHLLAEVDILADEAIIIAAGKLVGKGPVNEFTNTSTSTILLKTPQPERLMQMLASLKINSCYVTDFQTQDAAVVASIIVKDATQKQVGEAIAKSEIVIYEMTPQKATLEDVFLQLTANGNDTTVNGGHNEN